MLWLAIPILYGLVIAAGTGIEHAVETTPDRGRQTIIVLRHIATGLAIGSAIGLTLYFSVSHFTSGRYARQVRLIVEGPFLRQVTGGLVTEDKRVHFRAVSDYSTYDGPILRLFGIKALGFRVMGVQAPANKTIAGVVDADRVRNELSEIDALREI